MRTPTSHVKKIIFLIFIVHKQIEKVNGWILNQQSGIRQFSPYKERERKLKEWFPWKGGRFHAIKEINPSITREMRNVKKISPPCLPLVLSIMSLCWVRQRRRSRLLQGRCHCRALKFNLSLCNAALCWNISQQINAHFVWNLRAFRTALSRM